MQVPINTGNAKNTVSDVVLSKVSFQHMWRNVSAADSTNVFSFRVSSNGTNNDVSVTVPDGDYTVAGLCARITSGIATNLNLDGAGADTQTWLIVADGVVAANAVTSPGASDPLTGFVSIYLSNSTTVAGAITLRVNNTRLSRMLGFYNSSGDATLTASNAASSTTQKCIVVGTNFYDVRYARLYPVINVCIQGIPVGSTSYAGFETEFASSRDLELLCTVPISNNRFLDQIVYEPSTDLPGLQPIVTSTGTSPYIPVYFRWPDNSSVNFSNATVCLELSVVGETLDSLSLKRPRQG